MYTNIIKEFKGNGKVKMEQLEVKKLSINNSIVDFTPKSYTFTTNQVTPIPTPATISMAYTIIGTTVVGSLFFDSEIRFSSDPGRDFQIKNLNIANRLPVELRPVKESQVPIVISYISGSTTNTLSANLIITPAGDFRIANGEANSDNFPVSTVALPSGVGPQAKSGYLYSLL